MNKLAIIGSGGHAKVVFEAVRMSEATPQTVVVLDENQVTSDFWTSFAQGIEIESYAELSSYKHGAFHVAVGDNRIRRTLNEKVTRSGASAFSIVHPRATLSTSSSIGEGSFIAAGSIVAAATRIGKGSIVNHNTSVDHDCVIGDFCHLAPGVVVCGGVSIGSGTLLGAGSVIKPGINIGANSVVGAGAVVVNDITERTTCVGIPAREV